MGDKHRTEYRARQAATCWKVEHRVGRCTSCGHGGQWQTVFYTYPLLAPAVAEEYAMTVAELLNAPRDDADA
jgi:hypothetical protein